jgi:endonuclease YncB( thermonuclease family)
MLRVLIVAWALLLPALAWADLEGRVVGVTDGDTITVLLGTRLQIKVRLTEIDAPESRQALGSGPSSRFRISALGRQCASWIRERTDTAAR